MSAQERSEDSPDEPLEPVASGLDPEEGADVMQTRRESAQIAEARDDDERQDEDIITIDAAD